MATQHASGGSNLEPAQREPRHELMVFNRREAGLVLALLFFVALFSFTLGLKYGRTLALHAHEEFQRKEMETPSEGDNHGDGHGDASGHGGQNGDPHQDQHGADAQGHSASGSDVPSDARHEPHGATLQNSSHGEATEAKASGHQESSHGAAATAGGGQGATASEPTSASAKETAQSELAHKSHGDSSETVSRETQLDGKALGEELKQSSLRVNAVREPGLPAKKGGSDGAVFTVQIGSYPQVGDAAQRVALLKRLGFKDAFYLETQVAGKGTWYRVGSGRYSTKRKAEKEREEVHAALLSSGEAPSSVEGILVQRLDKESATGEEDGSSPKPENSHH